MVQSHRMAEIKTFNRTAQARRIRAMKPDSKTAEFIVSSEEERQAALKDAQSLFRAGVVEFRLKTWANSDGSFTVRAVKP